MNRKNSRSTGMPSLSAMLGATTLALSLLTGAAQAKPWRFSVTPYAWATDMGIDTKLDGRQVVDKTIPVGDLIKDIDTIFQMRLEATNGTFGVMIDAFDVTMSSEKYGVALPDDAGTADLASDIGMTIGDIAGIYGPQRLRGLAFLGGTRIINDRATIDATFRPAPGVSVAQSYDTDETLVDGLFGMRFGMPFSRHWGAQMQADVSTGGTDYTWSAGPTLSYSFGTLGRFGINAGYRGMKIDFQDEGGLDNQLTLSGFVVGFRASF
jgi:hypothetical protein